MLIQQAAFILVVIGLAWVFAQVSLRDKPISYASQWGLTIGAGVFAFLMAWVSFPMPPVPAAVPSDPSHYSVLLNLSQQLYPLSITMTWVAAVFVTVLTFSTVLHLEPEKHLREIVTRIAVSTNRAVVSEAVGTDRKHSHHGSPRVIRSHRR